MSDNGDYVKSDWKSYQRTYSGLTWRLATLDDLPAILKLWKAKERFLGCAQDLAPLFSRPTLITLVAEDADGNIVDGLVAEAHIDITKLGVSRTGFESTIAVADDIADWLKERGFRMASIVVPKSLSSRMAGVLTKMGFRSKESRSVYWSKRL